MIRKPRLKLELKERDMNSNQLERLKKDSREIGHYLTKIKKLGKDNLVHSIAKKTGVFRFKNPRDRRGKG